MDGDIINYPKSFDSASRSCGRRPFASATQSLGLPKQQNQCMQCSRYFLTRSKLELHLRRHAGIKDYLCDRCGIPFVSQFELNCHMRSHEPKRETFKCLICQLDFTDRSLLSKHNRIKHEDRLPYPCSKCLKRFETLNYLRRHESVHVGGGWKVQKRLTHSEDTAREEFIQVQERKRIGQYQCCICLKNYCRQSGLSRHRHVHTDKKDVSESFEANSTHDEDLE